nr:signal peptidase I [Clostridium taeniosporum]
MIKEWTINISVVATIAFLVWHFVGYSAWITSKSMMPTLEVKDRLLVARVHNFENLREGDIVLFKNDEFPDEILIKRLIGLPGDKIEIKHGVVFRNGEEIKENYVKNNIEYNRTFNVPENKFFFLGDNRAHSYDSRCWHYPFVDKSYIQGKAVLKYYPITNFEMFK